MKSRIPRKVIYVAPDDGSHPKGFPIGARILIDGRDEAIVRDYFPVGSSSYLWPHYMVRFVGGDDNVCVSVKRVGVTRRA